MKSFDTENCDNADTIVETTTVGDLCALKYIIDIIGRLGSRSTNSENACQGNLLLCPWHLQTS